VNYLDPYVKIQTMDQMRALNKLIRLEKLQDYKPATVRA
jgi:hypothetical protein